MASARNASRIGLIALGGRWILGRCRSDSVQSFRAATGVRQPAGVVTAGRVAHVRHPRRPSLRTPGWPPLDRHTARLDQGDCALAVGAGQRSTWRVLGDGRYQHSNVFAVGSPALTIGVLMGSALDNSTRRRQAAYDAQPRWVVDGLGAVTLTPRNLHFENSTCELVLERRALSAMELVARAPTP